MCSGECGGGVTAPGVLVYWCGGRACGWWYWCSADVSMSVSFTVLLL